jgi:hypothetical protein
MLIIILVVAVLVALPIYMWRRHGWNMISESTSTLMELVRSMMP